MGPGFTRSALIIVRVLLAVLLLLLPLQLAQEEVVLLAVGGRQHRPTATNTEVGKVGSRSGTRCSRSRAGWCGVGSRYVPELRKRRLHPFYAPLIAGLIVLLASLLRRRSRRMALRLTR